MRDRLTLPDQTAAAPITADVAWRGRRSTGFGKFPCGGWSRRIQVPPNEIRAVPDLLLLPNIIFLSARGALLLLADVTYGPDELGPGTIGAEPFRCGWSRHQHSVKMCMNGHGRTLSVVLAEAESHMPSQLRPRRHTDDGAQKAGSLNGEVQLAALSHPVPLPIRAFGFLCR